MLDNPCLIKSNLNSHTNWVANFSSLKCTRTVNKSYPTNNFVRVRASTWGPSTGDSDSSRGSYSYGEWSNISTSVTMTNNDGEERTQGRVISNQVQYRTAKWNYDDSDNGVSGFLYSGWSSINSNTAHAQVIKRCNNGGSITGSTCIKIISEENAF